MPESAARKRQRESQSKTNVDWTQPLPVRTNSASAPPTEKYESSNTNANTTTPGTPPRDYEWEAYQQHVEHDGGDSWEKLPAEPEETNDDVFEDENDEEDQIATDLTIRIGRMIICENVTGFFRPQYAEEVYLTPFDYQNPINPIFSIAETYVLAWETPVGASYLDFFSRWAESTSVLYASICRANAVTCALFDFIVGVFSGSLTGK